MSAILTKIQNEATWGNFAAIATRGLIYYGASKGLKEAIIYNTADLAVCFYQSSNKEKNGGIEIGLRSSDPAVKIVFHRIASFAIGLLAAQIAFSKINLATKKISFAGYADWKVALIANTAACLLGIAIEKYQGTSEILL